VRRSESGRRQQLPGRVSLIAKDAGRPSGRPAFGFALAALFAVAVLTCVSDAMAHAPSTSIGRAVAAFARVSVSYESGAAVSDIEAGNFPHVVGSNPKVAFMSPEAATEMQGGPDAIAAEIAREARLNGTLIVLVGTKLGAWSNELSNERLGKLVDEARANTAGGSSAETVSSLVRSVQSETADDTPWGWLIALIAVLAIGSLVVLALVSRRSRVPRG
jgi:hypothetical protein